MSSDPHALQDDIGYRFRVAARLEQALTHRSFSQESLESSPHNERLEFLGDAVLGFVVSGRLIERFPSYSEGQLTKIKAYLVSSANLITVARNLDLGRYLRLGRGEELSGGRGKKALLVNSLEAVIAAVYLDGGLGPAAQVVDRHIVTPAALAAADQNIESENSKSTLQELLQAEKMPAPQYRIVQEKGPPHRRQFTVELNVGGLFRAAAQGSTRKSAEQEAARAALLHFRAQADKLPCNADTRQSVE